MKRKWSSKWTGSRQPRKQRKFRHNAPLHVRHKFVSVHLSPHLRERYGKRSLPVRQGDEVEIARGKDRGMRGKVERVDLKRGKVYIAGMNVKKSDGSEVMRPFQPSNLKAVSLNLDDKMRTVVLERAGGSGRGGKEKETKEQKTEIKVKEGGKTGKIKLKKGLKRGKTERVKTEKDLKNAEKEKKVK
jgi:large subunit ribosomal protein L24